MGILVWTLWPAMSESVTHSSSICPYNLTPLSVSWTHQSRSQLCSSSASATNRRTNESPRTESLAILARTIVQPTSQPSSESHPCLPLSVVISRVTHFLFLSDSPPSLTFGVSSVGTSSDSNVFTSSDPMPTYYTATSLRGPHYSAPVTHIPSGLSHPVLYRSDGTFQQSAIQPGFSPSRGGHHHPPRFSEYGSGSLLTSSYNGHLSNESLSGGYHRPGQIAQVPTAQHHLPSPYCGWLGL